VPQISVKIVDADGLVACVVKVVEFSDPGSIFRCLVFVVGHRYDCCVMFFACLSCKGCTLFLYSSVRGIPDNINGYFIRLLHSLSCSSLSPAVVLSLFLSPLGLGLSLSLGLGLSLSLFSLHPFLYY